MTQLYPGVGGARHKARAGGVSAGGNALSHHPGMPAGYTGFVPGSACVPPTVHTHLTERAPDATLARHPAARAAAEAEEAATAGRATTYQATFKTDLHHDYTAAPRARPNTAAVAATAARGIVEQERLPPSTYQADMLGQRDGSSPARSCASAPASPAAGMPAVRPGYLTTSCAAQLPIAESYASASLLRSCSSSPKAPGRGSQATNGRGTARSVSAGAPWAPDTFAQPPPAGGSPHSRAAQPKADAFLFALDQHSRGRVPGDTRHRPQHGVALEPPPPSRLTTWGAASQQALRRPSAPPEPGYSPSAGGGRVGLLGGFSSGSISDFVSENGLAEAARFYQVARPLEGRSMRIPQPSRTAPRGAPYTG